MIISMINNLIFVTFALTNLSSEALFQKDQILCIPNIPSETPNIPSPILNTPSQKKIYATPNTPNGYLLCLSWICVISGKYFQRNKIWGNLSFVKITSSSGRDFVLFQTNSVYEFSARNRWKFTSSSGRDFSSSSALILIHLSASCNKTSHGLISLTSLGKWDIEKSRKVVSDHYRRKVV